MTCTNPFSAPTSTSFLFFSTKRTYFLCVILFFLIVTPVFGVPTPGISGATNSTFSILEILRSIHLPLSLNISSIFSANVPLSSALLIFPTPLFLSYFERRKSSTISSNLTSSSITNLPASATELKISAVHSTTSSNTFTEPFSLLRIAENSTHPGASTNSTGLNLKKTENGEVEFNSLATSDNALTEVPTATPFEKALSGIPTSGLSNATDNELANSTHNATDVNNIVVSDISDTQRIDSTSLNGGTIASFLAEARSQRNRIMNGGFIELIEWLFVFILVAPGTFPAIGCILYSCTSFFHRRLLANGEPPASATIHSRRHWNMHPMPTHRHSLYDHNTSFNTRPRFKSPSDEREDL